VTIPQRSLAHLNAADSYGRPAVGGFPDWDDRYRCFAAPGPSHPTLYGTQQIAELLTEQPSFAQYGLVRRCR